MSGNSSNDVMRRDEATASVSAWRASFAVRSLALMWSHTCRADTRTFPLALALASRSARDVVLRAARLQRLQAQQVRGARQVCQRLLRVCVLPRSSRSKARPRANHKHNGAIGFSFDLFIRMVAYKSSMKFPPLQQRQNDVTAAPLDLYLCLQLSSEFEVGVDSTARA